MSVRFEPYHAQNPISLGTDPGAILVRSPNWLGDAVICMPAVQRLHERFPNAKIAMLTHEKLAGLWEYHPDVDCVIPFSATENVFSVGRRLRTERFDLALILPNSHRSALESWLGRIPKRIGLSHPWRNWLLTHPVAPRKGHTIMRKRSTDDIRRLIADPRPPSFADGASIPPAAHQCHDFLHLSAALGADPLPVPPQLRVTTVEMAETAARFGLTVSSRADSRTGVFGLNAGAEYGPAKRWPADRFIDAAVEIQRQRGCRWLIFGGNADLPLTSQISQAIEASLAKLPEDNRKPPLNLAGKTTLPELCALLGICNLLLTNDTGPMHVAAAVGTPVIVPFGSTSPELTGPGIPGDQQHRLLKSDAPCAPCFLRECPIDFRCMKSIAVERVVTAALQVVGVIPKG